MADQDELTFETGEATGIIPEGPNRGTITGVELDDSSGYEYVRINVETETDVEMSVSFPAPEDKLTNNHGLGEAVERFGTELGTGNKVNLAEVFAAGQEVAFEAYEDDDTGYMEIDESSFRPAGQDAPEDSGSESGQDVEVSDQLKDVLDGQEGQNKNAVIGQIAGTLGGEYVEEFNQAVEAGVVQVDGNDQYQGLSG